MGGVGGHLMHLHDDRDLTFNKMKSILSAASRGEIEGTEKTDGFNIYLGIKNDAGGWAPVWARNKGDMQINGKTFADLTAREFKGGENIKKVYLDAFSAYQSAISSLNDNEKTKIFGQNRDIFYNTEIQGPGASNVVNYDADVLSIHHSGHKRYTPETDTIEIVPENEIKSASNFLDSVIDKFEEATSNQDFSVRRTAMLQLNKLDDDYDLNIALQRMQKAGFSGNTTIEQFLENYLKGETERKLNFLSPDIQQDVVDRILKKEGFKTLTQLYKGFPPDVKLRIKQFVDTDKKMISDAVWPIELAIHDLAVELLKSLKSAYILDNEAELSRLKNGVEEAIRTIQSYQGEHIDEIHNILARQLEKLKHHDKITTVVEGFVFQVGEQMYKFTGNFAPVNQLLGLFKYGRGKVPPLKKDKGASDVEVIGEQPMEEPEIEEADQTYALVPGKFKPPHRGHLDMVKHYSKLADKVIILISPLAKEYGEGKEITASDSIRIWDLYIQAAGLTNVDIEISEFNSPVQAAIEYGNKSEMHGKNILLGASTKGGDAVQRFGKNVQKYVPNAKILDPLKYAFEPTGIELNATDFRNAMASPEKNIESFLPEEVKDKAHEILNILNIEEVRKLREEANPLPLGIFLGLIEEVIEEGFFKSKEEKALANIYKKFPLTLRGRTRANNVREWTELGATPKMINQLLTLKYYGVVYPSNGIDRIRYAEIPGILNVGDTMAWNKREKILNIVWPMTVPNWHIHEIEFRHQLLNYYKSIGLRFNNIVGDIKKTIDKPPEPPEEKWVPIDYSDARYSSGYYDDIAKAGGYYSGGGVPSSERHVQMAHSKIWKASLKLFKGARKQVKTWQEFVALNNYPPAVEVRGDELIESDSSKKARENHLNQTVHKALPLPIPLEVVKSGKFDSWIKGAGAKYGGGLSLATPEGEKGALSVADETGGLTLKEEELEEISTIAGGNVEGGPTKGVFTGLNIEKENEKERKRSKKNMEEELIDEIYNYLFKRVSNAH